MSLGGAGNPIYQVRCLPSEQSEKGRELFRFEIDGEAYSVKLKIENLTQKLVSQLPERSLDLLEIAALVYGADSAKSRGGSIDQQMGKNWHRQFQIKMPVRDFEFWNNLALKRELEEMLMFLSGDRFVFKFVTKTIQNDDPRQFFKFAKETGWQPDRVLMFSGGLDSFAGALEEIAEQKQKLALVSHFSSTKIQPKQKALKSALLEKFGAGFAQHIPIEVHMKEESKKEGTHRARSFLFAVLGSVTAQAYGLNRVSFYENGVVSLNLPPVGNVLGTRATRTTHPQTLTRFSGFLGRVFDGGMRVDNPYFWRTKKEVVETIHRLGMADEIKHTRSCADVYNQAKQYPHCGRCSQCIDRRFAVLAAGLERFDPNEAYRVDLLEGARESVVDRETALSYVRNAFAYEHMTPQQLLAHFPAVLDALEHLEQPSDAALGMINDLLRRHASGVTSVMQNALKTKSPSDYPEASLPRLYGDVQAQVLLPQINVEPVPQQEAHIFHVSINEAKNIICFDQAVEFRNNATAKLLIVLAKNWLDGAGRGLELLDYPMIKSGQLASEFGLENEESLRKRIARARTDIRKKFSSADLDVERANQLIENIPWQGYRLNPELVLVRKVKSPN